MANTHLERISFRKFKFLDQDEVYFKCKINICEKKPCGQCINNDSPLNPINRKLYYNY